MKIILSTGYQYDLFVDRDVNNLKKNISTMHNRDQLDRLFIIYQQVESYRNYVGDAPVNQAHNIYQLLISKTKFREYIDSKVNKSANVISQVLPMPAASSIIAQPIQSAFVASTILQPTVYSEPPITDVCLFPRSEYYTRFEETTAFAMNEPNYWGTYHRSESSRFFDKAGGRKNTQFLSPCTKKAPGTHSFSAHTGGFYSPFSVNSYSDAIQLEKLVDEGSVNVRDRLLLYKDDMAKIVVECFARLETNQQQGKYCIRPIVYSENK